MMEAGGKGKGARVRRVAATAMAAAMLLLLVVFQSHSPSSGLGQLSRTELIGRAAEVAHDAKRHDLGAVLRAAGAQGAVQPVSAKSKEIAFHNVITHALAAAAPAGSGKSSAFIKAAAVAAVHTHMKRPTPSLLKEAAEEAADEDEGPADREFNLLSNLADVNPTKVLVKMYMESECPLCRHYATRFLPHILNATGLADVVDFEYIAFGLGHIEEQARKGNKTVDEVLNTTDELNPELHHLIEDSKADAAKLEIICKNGETECEGNGWEACLQDVAPWQTTFPVFKCIEGKGCDKMAAEGCNPYAGSTAHDCMESYGGNINKEELKNCFSGTRVRELLVMNDIATLDADVKWVPWFTVDGDKIVKKEDLELIMGKGDMALRSKATADAVQEQFFLGKKICETYVRKSGKPAPEGCFTFPQDVAELGADPYKYFETANLTALSLKHQESGSYSQSSYMLTDAELELGGGQNWVELVALAVVAVGVLGVGVWYFMRVKNTPTPEHTSQGDREKANQEQSLLSSSDNP